MANLKSSFFALVISSILLAGCGNPINSLNNVSGVSAQSFVTPVNIDNIGINNSIDFATGTKNTFNNINVKFFMDGKNAYPALENLIMGAKESLYIEVFQFNNDFTGRKFADALVNKHKEGVEVKVLYDFVGNTDVKLMNYMAKNGVHIETYNKQVFTSKGTNITHRKVFIADGLRAMTGGMNIGEKYAHEWHDTMMSYEGEAVKDTLKEFFADWKRAGNKLSKLMQKAMDNPIQIKTDEKKYPLRVTVTSPKEVDKKEDIKRMMVAAIDSAKDNVKIAMPYFSDDEFIEHLILAKKRGIKVTALMPKDNNQKLFDLVSTNTTNQLVVGDVEVFRTGAKDHTFSHSKVLTVDNTWTTIGSCNADRRAFHINQELNVAISDPEFAQEVNRIFFDSLIQNAEKGTYKDIPWYKKPLFSFVEGFDDFL